MDKNTLPKKQLIWIIPMCILVGAFLGFIIDFPNKFEIKIEVVNETKEWWDESFYDLENLTSSMKNMCCYPSNCAQAENNPEQCTCTYMVYCYEGDENGTEIYTKQEHNISQWTINPDFLISDPYYIINCTENDLVYQLDYGDKTINVTRKDYCDNLR